MRTLAALVGRASQALPQRAGGASACSFNSGHSHHACKDLGAEPAASAGAGAGVTGGPTPTLWKVRARRQLGMEQEGRDPKDWDEILSPSEGREGKEICLFVVCLFVCSRFCAGHWLLVWGKKELPEVGLCIVWEPAGQSAPFCPPSKLLLEMHRAILRTILENVLPRSRGPEKTFWI